MADNTTCAIDSATALELLKSRLNRLPGDTSLDEMLGRRIESAAQQLTAIGINLTSETRDLMLVVDLAAWQYQNRDKPGTMPEWLRYARFERWLESGVTG